MFLTLVLQHALRMRHIFIFGLPFSTIFFHISHKWHGFRKKLLKIKTCFDFLYNLSPKHSHSKKNWASYDEKCISVFKRSARYYYFGKLMKLEFSWYIFEKYVSNFMKIRPVGAELSHAARRMDRQTWRRLYYKRYSVKVSNKIGFNLLYQIWDHVNVTVS
jgi:hypothetical protein